MPNADGGETEQEYLERIHNVPGIFSDRNESAHAVVTLPQANLAEAEALAKATTLAPVVHPEDEKKDGDAQQPTQASLAVEQPVRNEPQGFDAEAAAKIVPAGPELPAEDVPEHDEGDASLDKKESETVEADDSQDQEDSTDDSGDESSEQDEDSDGIVTITSGNNEPSE